MYEDKDIVDYLEQLKDEKRILRRLLRRRLRQAVAIYFALGGHLR